MVKPLTPEIEVLAALGAWALRQARGRPEMIEDIKRQVMPRFVERYPHHKVLAHWCMEALEAPEKDVTPGLAPPAITTDEQLTVGELIERLYFFPSMHSVLGQIGEGSPAEIAGVEDGELGVILRIKPPDE